MNLLCVNATDSPLFSNASSYSICFLPAAPPPLSPQGWCIGADYCTLYTYLVIKMLSQNHKIYQCIHAISPFLPHVLFSTSELCALTHSYYNGICNSSPFGLLQPLYRQHSNMIVIGPIVTTNSTVNIITVLSEKKVGNCGVPHDPIVEPVRVLFTSMPLYAS